jgi:hypothetical protein
MDPTHQAVSVLVHRRNDIHVGYVVDHGPVLETIHQDMMCQEGELIAGDVLALGKMSTYELALFAVTSVAVGAAAFQRVGEGGYGGLLIQDGFAISTWATFPHGLGPEACRALAVDESLKVRVDVTIYETADTYGRWVSPTRGDTRVVWPGSLAARRP